MPVFEFLHGVVGQALLGLLSVFGLAIVKAGLRGSTERFWSWEVGNVGPDLVFLALFTAILKSIDLYVALAKIPDDKVDALRAGTDAAGKSAFFALAACAVLVLLVIYVPRGGSKKVPKASLPLREVKAGHVAVTVERPGEKTAADVAVAVEQPDLEYVTAIRPVLGVLLPVGMGIFLLVVALQIGVAS